MNQKWNYNVSTFLLQKKNKKLFKLINIETRDFNPDVNT